MVSRLALLLLPFCLLAENRVLLISLDGLGYQNLTNPKGPGRELKTLHRLAHRGLIAPLQTSFPSKTSAGHAALFTGAWAGGNGIFSNTNPRQPRSQYALRETITGFRSETLTAEPIWTAAARQGVSAVAYQSTQLYPFNERSAGKAVAVNGYQSWTIAPARVLRAADLKGGTEWKDGPLTFRVERLAKGLRISFGSNSVDVSWMAPETAGPRNRPLARHFSEPLWVEANGIRTGVYFRLFEFSPGDFLLYRTSAQELAHSGELSFDLQAETGPFVGNSATGLYERGEFGRILPQGGDGTAERRYLETMELCVRQLTRQTVALIRKQHPRLMVGYYPVIDDIEHAWYGLSATGTAAVDAFRAHAYAALDEGLRQVVATYHLKRDAVLFTSDHGMAANTHEIRMSALLSELGFPREQVVPNVSCLFINTADWKSGVVDPATKPALVAALEQKLRGAAGGRLFTRFYHADALAERFGLKGPNAPDLCFDMKSGYYPVESARTPAIAPYPYPKGEHGFDPTRPDMQSYLIASGRGIARQMPPCGDCYRAIDVSPTIAAILKLTTPPGTQGKPIPVLKAPVRTSQAN
jgi:predicted AlkP superfamily pyrophosphatase or phosphodiesterase